jgi:hypothetical protein
MLKEKRKTKPKQSLKKKILKLKMKKKIVKVKNIWKKLKKMRNITLGTYGRNGRKL